MKQPITLFSVAKERADKQRAEDNIEHAQNVLKEMKIRVNNSKIAVSVIRVEQIVKHGSNHAVIVVNDSGKSRMKRAVHRLRRLFRNAPGKELCPERPLIQPCTNCLLPKCSPLCNASGLLRGETHVRATQLTITGNPAGAG